MRFIKNVFGGNKSRWQTVIVYGWKKYPNAKAGMLKVEEEGMIRRIAVTVVVGG